MPPQAAYGDWRLATGDWGFWDGNSNSEIWNGALRDANSTLLLYFI
ncbi:MAG: hypothetical protein AAFX80_14580 [Cyanobacteria bacterium J06639_18]